MEKNLQESDENEIKDQADRTNGDMSHLVDKNGNCFKSRKEKFKAAVEALLNKQNKDNLSDKATATDDVLSPKNEENVENINQPMKLDQVLENKKLTDFHDEFRIAEYRNPDPPNVDVDSGVSETMENFNWDNDDDDTPQSPAAVITNTVPSFDQPSMISICQKINAIDDHLCYFNVINSLILKRAEELSSLGYTNDEIQLDRDNYLFLKTVRGALIHKALGEKMEDQVLTSMMNICQDIDELLHPKVQVLYDNFNESFSFEEWSEIFIENHSDKKEESFGLLYVLDDFGNEISPQKKKKRRQPRLEALDLKVIDKANWTIDEPII